MSSDSPRDLLEWARKVQAIAQNGLAFTTDPFDRERYTQLSELVAMKPARQQGGKQRPVTPPSRR